VNGNNKLVSLAGSELCSLPAFCLSLYRENPWRATTFWSWNKYNPSYNLLTMPAKGETVKLRPRGNMTKKKNENIQENQTILSTGTHEGFFEIRVKGHLDESWSDWLEGLEVKLLENGEMKLFGHIGDQAALMGILNKLYGLNLALLSVSKVERKK
jgi:hypothetical protein